MTIGLKNNFFTNPTHSSQGIIDWSGRKKFAKEPELANFLQDLKLTLLLHNEKVHWFFSHVRNGEFAVFWVLCCEVTCKWVLFSSIDVYFFWLAQIIGKYNRLVIACIVNFAKKKRHILRVLSFCIVFFLYLCAATNGQFSI